MNMKYNKGALVTLSWVSARFFIYYYIGRHVENLVLSLRFIPMTGLIGILQPTLKFNAPKLTDPDFLFVFIRPKLNLPMDNCAKLIPLRQIYGDNVSPVNEISGNIGSFKEVLIKLIPSLSNFIRVT